MESAKSIAKESSSIFLNKYVEQLVNWYIYYMKQQEERGKYKNFHGLRDFYSMIKTIAEKMTD
jgi:hypothetical protein